MGSVIHHPVHFVFYTLCHDPLFFTFKVCAHQRKACLCICVCVWCVTLAMDADCRKDLRIYLT